MSNHFEVRNGELFAEDVAVRKIAAEFGTPTYIYSRATLERHLRAWQEPLGDRGNIYYSVKACLLYTSPSPRDQRGSRMPSSA